MNEEAAAAPVDRDAVRKRHAVHVWPDGSSDCWGCHETWPCVTIRLLDEVERLEKLASVLERF